MSVLQPSTHSGESPQQVGADAGRGLEHEHATGPEQIHGQLGADLGGEEQPETGVRLQRMQLLLQLY